MVRFVAWIVTVIGVTVSADRLLRCQRKVEMSGFPPDRTDRLKG